MGGKNRERSKGKRKRERQPVRNNYMIKENERERASDSQGGTGMYV